MTEKDNATHILSVRCVDRLCCYTPVDELERLKMVLGLEIILINVSKLTIIGLASVALGVLTQTALVMSGFAVIKRYAFGLHAKRSTTCTVVSLCMFVLAPYLLQGMTLHPLTVAIVFTCVIILLALYAPADTEAHPLVGRKNRLRLKRRAIIAGLAVMLLALLVPNRSIALLLTLGACFEVATVLPITYKILNRKEHNYAEYE